MDNLHWLDQISPDQLASVGFKAYHLGHLKQKGYPIVPGFVVSAEVPRLFLGSIAWSDPLFADLPNSSLRLDIHNPGQLRAIAQRIRRGIEIAPLPATLLGELAIAAAQFQSPALVLRPSLYIGRRPTTPLTPKQLPDQGLTSGGLLNLQVSRPDIGSLTQGLKHLWADLFSAKSLFYWQQLGIHLQQVNLAVLVQPIQSAIAAGTVHTSLTHFEIRSTLGLGMAIAWGEVLPDSCQIDTETGKVQARQLGRKTIAYRIAEGTPIADGGERQTPQADAEPSVPVVPTSAPQSLGQSVEPTATTHGSSRPDAQAGTLEAVASIPSVLERYLLDDSQREQDSLVRLNLEQLTRMIQAAVMELGPQLDLEWVLYGDGANPHLLLTQATPYQLPVQELPTHASGRSQQDGGTQGFHQALDSAATIVPEMLPNAILIASGLAVSGGQTIARATVISQSDDPSEDILAHTVLVASSIPLDWLPLLQQAAALIAEQGSMTSHSAIVAREMGVPAVMGVANATRSIRTGDLLWVDGDRGKIYLISDSTKRPPTLAQPDSQLQVSVLPPSGEAPAIQHPPLSTQLLVNLNHPEHLERMAALPVGGVGLLRAELLALSILDHQHPLVWMESHRKDELRQRLATSIQDFARAFMPRPVFYRSFDLRSHEFHHQPDRDRSTRQPHPTLGMRGTYSYWIDPTLFILELSALALVQASGYANVHLILPFVRTVEEFQFCRRLVEQAGLFHNPDFQLWIMAEVPSVLLLLQDYVKAGVQGISIGTNDLTQLLLGVDRDESQLAVAFEQRHPAVKRAIAHLVRQSQDLGIPCSICGEAPARYPELIQDLVRWGIHSISVAPEAVESTYWAIAHAERKQLLETLQLTTSADP